MSTRSTTAAALAVAAALVACNGPPLPPDGGGAPVLAPLETGDRWTYRITDPLAGVFEKRVEVLGPAAIPESSTAIAIRDVEPTHEEQSWVDVQDGFLVRHREEDRKSGVLVRVTTWTPGAPKILAVLAETGFNAQITVTESEWHPDGTVSTKNPIYAFAVVATGVSVTVPAGTYTCIQLERQRLDRIEPKRTFWLSPGVGKVREEGERLEELVAFVPGP